MTTTPICRKATLILGEADIRVDGFIDGRSWNGWACPYFTFETAKRILIASEAQGYRWHFDNDANAFVVTHTDDAEDSGPEFFFATKILVDEIEFAVYPVGAYAWTWQVA